MAFFTRKLSNELSGSTLPFIAFCIALNLSVGQITSALKIPLYLDSVGTVLVAVLSGPWAGAIAGIGSNLIAGAVLNPTMLFFSHVSMVVGIVAAYAARLRWFNHWYGAVIGGLLLGGICAVLSAPVSAYLFGGTMMAGTDFFVLFFRAMGNSILESVFYQGLSSDPIDKMISFLIVFLIIKKMPLRLLRRFKGANYLCTDDMVDS
jgi:energy-coupling factor transport system substrate-specific component